MGRVFQHRRTVRFGECDPAGVVYYPVFFNWFHEAMEAWFEEGLGTPYAEATRSVGFPARSTEAGFHSPCRMGERLTVLLSLSRLGRSSMRLELRIEGDDGGLRATGSVSCVCIGVEPDGFRFKSQAIPETLRERMEPFLVSAVDGGQEA